MISRNGDATFRSGSSYLVHRDCVRRNEVLIPGRTHCMPHTYFAKFTLLRLGLTQITNGSYALDIYLRVHV